MARTFKGMLKKTGDLQLALLSYRSTPLPWCGLSPSELCMGRHIRSAVPQTKQLLTPTWSYLPQFRKDNSLFKKKQKDSYDRRHAVKEQPTIPNDSEVVVTTDSCPVQGRVVTPAESPRSYIVETPSGDLRRNRSQLNVMPDSPELPVTESDQPVCDNQTEPPPVPRRIVTRSQTGTTITPPERL